MFNFLSFGTFLSLFSVYHTAQLVEVRNAHYPQTLTNPQLNYLAELSNVTQLNKALDNICIPRVVGTSGHDKVHNYIVSELRSLGWDVEVDSFEEETPIFGVLKFRNIIATLNPDVERYLVLACHYDSKYFKEFDFEGATDSAVPCAMMLNLASVMKKELEPLRDNVDLKLIFFDGEEAFRKWEAKDSIYGARHLAAKYEKQDEITSRGLKVTRLDRLDMLILLDLLGTANPRFYSYFGDTNKWYLKLVEAEQRLRKQKLLKRSAQYFKAQQVQGFIEDDHVPFLQRGVPILHVIPTPFPDVWHKVSDNREAVDISTTENLNKILRVFVAEYLHLDIDEENPDDEDALHVEL